MTFFFSLAFVQPKTKTLVGGGNTQRSLARNPLAGLPRPPLGKPLKPLGDGHGAVEYQTGSGGRAVNIHSKNSNSLRKKYVSAAAAATYINAIKFLNVGTCV